MPAGSVGWCSRCVLATSSMVDIRSSCSLVFWSATSSRLVRDWSATLVGKFDRSVHRVQRCSAIKFVEHRPNGFPDVVSIVN